MKIKKILMIISTLIIITSILSMYTKVYARDNLAFAAGTTNGINTVQDVNDAMNAYGNAGYNRYSYIDPSRDTLWSYLYADVQYFPTHGSLISISFSNSGIMVGNDSGNYIGTNSVHWDADTILVTYASCMSAGTNNNFSENSITYQTAARGADVTVGFRDSINSGSATNWGKRYNDKLGSGSGVQDAVNYANSFIYIDPRVKETHIVHHGNANMRIGRYRSNSISLDERNLLKEPIKLTNAKTNNLIDVMKKNIPDFNSENYVIKETNGLMTTNINTDETTLESNYIDFQLKIGDFYTEAGYTVKMKGNEIEAIYNNNIDKVKQSQALEQENDFKINIKTSKVNDMKEKAKKNLEAKYAKSGIKINDNIDSTYYYDIANNKKYISFSIPSTTENGDIAFETVNYEI